MNSPKYKITFKMDLEDFRQLNKAVEEKMLGKQKKRSAIMGCIQLFVAIAYLVVVFATKSVSSTIYMVLAFFLLISGLFSILYYPVFFKKKLDKVIDKTYEESEHLQNDITYEFFEDKFTEKNSANERELKYDVISSIVETDTKIVIFIGRGGIGFPKDKLDANTQEFIEFIDSKIVKNKSK